MNVEKIKTYPESFENVRTCPNASNGTSVWIAPLEMDSPGARRVGVGAAYKGPLQATLKHL